jgi:putative pyruvate formate lyase activating enzyme
MATCLDCSRGCPSRDEAFCGLRGDARVAWMGTTYAEEHEIAPTFELFLTGCSLRCSFCSMREAVGEPGRGAPITPERLVETLVDPATPPFRTVAFVGGEPTVNLPFLRQAVPLIRARLPGVGLVLNTNLWFHPKDVAWMAENFDVVLGDLHFGNARCASSIAGAADYSAVSADNAKRLLEAGAFVLLRILVLPGHVDCCAVPSAAQVRRLAHLQGARGRLLARMHTGYAPVGEAAADPILGRHLSPDEKARALELLGDDVPAPSPLPLPGFPRRRPCSKDAAAVVEVDTFGRTLIPFVTGDLLPLAARLDPSLAPALAYLAP